MVSYLEIFERIITFIFNIMILLLLCRNILFHKIIVCSFITIKVEL
jgi:hypothetical protein